MKKASWRKQYDFQSRSFKSNKDMKLRPTYVALIQPPVYVCSGQIQ